MGRAGRLPAGALRGALLGALLFSAAERSLGAQQVSGTLRRSIDSLPVAGALVVLSDSSGRDVATTVSTERGAFGFAVPAGGMFRLRVLRIGMRPFGPRTVSVPASGRTSVGFYLPEMLIELPAIIVAAERSRCGNPPDNSVLGVLLQEARKAIAITEATLAERRLVFVVETWRRHQTPGLLTLDSTPAISMDRGWPIRSAPPESLRTWGFVRDEPDPSGRAATTYYGPDARVLFADWFLDSHCLRMGRAPAPGQLALEFRPERPTRNVDIAGRFVFDSTTLALRELSWRWLILPPWVPDDVQGGFVRFEQMASGGWLPVAWSLRAPVAQLDVRRGVQLGGYLELGGRVTEQAGGAASETMAMAVRRAATSVIEGTVSDTAGAPIADARVTTRPSGISLLTDSAGRFHLGSLRPGTILLQVHSVGYVPAGFLVRVGPDSTVRADVRLEPSRFRLDTVVVTASPEVAGLQINGFYERLRDRQRGAGTASFVTPEQIELRHAVKATDLLQMLPGVHMGQSHGVVIPYGREFGCVMNVLVDGAPVKLYRQSAMQENTSAFARLPENPQGPQPGSGIDDFLSASDVAAIEVYQTPSEIPAQFDMINNRCGTIVIWTGSRR